PSLRFRCAAGFAYGLTIRPGSWPSKCWMASAAAFLNFASRPRRYHGRDRPLQPRSRRGRHRSGDRRLVEPGRGRLYRHDGRLQCRLPDSCDGGHGRTASHSHFYARDDAAAKRQPMLTAQRAPTRTKIEDQTRGVLDAIASAPLVEIKKSVGGGERCLFGSSPYASNTLAQNRRFSCHFGSVTSAARHSFLRHAGCERPAPLTSKTNKLDIIVDRTKQGDKLVKRVCEEELMDVPLQAESYPGADFSEPNSKFVAHFADKFPAFQGHH